MKSTISFKRGLMAFAMILSLGSFTACRPKNHEAKMEWIADKVTDKLDLTKDQEKKFKDLLTSVHESRKSQKEEMKGFSESLKSMIQSDKLNKDQVSLLIGRKQAQVKSTFEAAYPKLETFHESLTPDQKKEIIELVDKFSNKMYE